MSAEPIPLAPETRVRRWHAWLVVWRVHRWLGFLAGALTVLLSATGSLLVVHHELEARLERDRRFAPEDATLASAPLRDVARQVAALAPPGYRLLRLLPADEPDAAHQFIFAGGPDNQRWSAFVAPRSGRVLWHGADQALFTPWLLGLHMQLHAGKAGYVATGLAGIGLTLLGLSGLYLHRERWRGLWRAPFRPSRGWRVALGDLHRWIGIAAIYFPLVLGVTGTIYAVTSLRAKPPVAADPPSIATLAEFEPMLATARERFPDAEVLRLQFPADRSGPVVALVVHRGNPPWQKFSRLEFDARTGALKRVRAAEAATPREQFASMLAPLHFGFYGATWVKWAYFVGGLAPALLALTGWGLAWIRRRGAPARAR
ncbi:MAG: PepSY domain-containing protein [Opitutae bacterium]|nr:PepSY domain-containing protein [Opitutae bacterium]